MSENRFSCEKLQKLYWLNYVETKCYHRRIIWKIGPPRWIGKCGSVPAKLANSRTARSGAAWSLANGKRQAWRGAGGESNVTRPMHGSGPGDTCGECEPSSGHRRGAKSCPISLLTEALCVVWSTSSTEKDKNTGLKICGLNKTSVAFKGLLQTI